MSGDRYRLAASAHSKVNRAKKLGLLPWLDGSIACVDCGGIATDYEHRDYFNPLDVEPVCHRCNLKRPKIHPHITQQPGNPRFVVSEVIDYTPSPRAIQTPPVMLQFDGWRCERCEHEWVPRNMTDTPAVCPKCKSPYWNRPRRQPKVKRSHE